MGQFALGLRSLLIKSAIFVVMAALLAWALGGTLWPKPVRAVTGGTLTFAEHDWYWLATIHGTDPATSGPMIYYELNHRAPNAAPKPFDQRWRQHGGLLSHGDRLYIAGQPQNNPLDQGWEIVEIGPSLEIVNRFPMPDRLAVEQQLERVKMGLPIQDAETIRQQRERVLNPQ